MDISGTIIGQWGTMAANREIKGIGVWVGVWVGVRVGVKVNSTFY